MNLSSRQLRAFHELAETRNFTRASQRCHLSQSAFSTLISNLEDQAGVRLFHRSTRHVELTPEGVIFEGVAARLLHDLENAFTELQDHVQRRKGRLTIAALPSIAGGALPPVIARFRSEYPGIEMILRDVTADTCLDLVRNRQADLALTATVSPGPDLSSKPLLQDTFHLVCRSDHPLASRKRVTIVDVIELPMIRFERASSIRQHLDLAFYPHQPPTAMEIHNPVTAAGLVAHGVGVTLIPTLALYLFRAPGLVAIPVTLPIGARNICLVRRQDDAPSVAADTFVALLQTMWSAEGRKTARSRPK